MTIRTIQRIESEVVKPRAFTIKMISEALSFDFSAKSDTGYDVDSKNQTLKLVNRSFFWYLKDLFNLKTNAMKKISVLSVSVFLIVLSGVSILNANAQARNFKNQKNLIIQMNDDNSVKRVEAAFSHNLTLDSLVQIRQELQNIGITIHYRKIEFDVHQLLLSLDCEVICNDGYSGSFGTGDLSRRNRNERIGFFRDYSSNCESPFGTGLIDSK